jgi:hypothetical protein
MKKGELVGRMKTRIEIIKLKEGKFFPVLN